MDASRNRWRGKFLGCFRPFEDDESFSHSSSLQSSSGEAGGGNRRRLRRSLSAALKAVIFKSALLKKSRSEKNQEKGLRNNILSTAKRFVKSAKQNAPRKQRAENDDVSWSNRSPLFSSNSSSSSSSSTASISSSSQSSPARSEIDTIQRAISLDQHLKRIKRTKNKQKSTKKDRKRGYIIPSIELCVLVVCLFALIWGKTFAVVTCTSAWLFFAPSSRSPKPRRPATFEVMDSEEYKKRVIMQGWLERDRTRF